MEIKPIRGGGLKEAKDVIDATLLGNRLLQIADIVLSVLGEKTKWGV